MLLRHTLIYFVGFAITGLIALAATSTYTRLVLPAEYAQYAVLQMFLAAVVAGAFEWVRVTLLRWVGQGAAKGSGFFTDFALLYLCGAAAAILVAMALGYVQAYALHGFAWFLAAVWAVAHAATDVILVHARVRLKPFHYIGFQIGRASAAFVLSVGLILMGLGAIGLVLGIALANLAVAIIGTFVYKPRDVGLRPREASRSRMHEIAAFGMPVGVSALLGFGVGYADRLLVVTFLDPADAGAYAFTGDFVQRTLSLLSVVVSTAAFPHAVRIFEEQGKEAARAQMSYNLALAAAILVPASIGLCIAVDAVARLVAGAAFRPHFVWILPWLVAAAMIGGLRYFVCDMPLQLVKATRSILLPSGVTLAAALCLGVVLVPGYGLAGALAAAITSQSLGLFVSMLVARRTFHFALPWRELAKIAVAVILMSLVYRGVARQDDLPWNLAAMAAAALAYAATFVLCNGLGLRGRVMKLAQRRGSGAE